LPQKKSFAILPSMTLDVDGKRTENPDDEAIAQGFESIDKRTGFRSGGLSLVILSRSEGNSLTTGGHPAEGWNLLHEANGVTRDADISAPLRQEKIIQIFQSYARGDDMWEKEFQWDIIDQGKWPVKRIVIMVVVLLVIFFCGRSCIK
jgi:hypothetical protein